MQTGINNFFYFYSQVGNFKKKNFITFSNVAFALMQYFEIKLKNFHLTDRVINQQLNKVFLIKEKNFFFLQIRKIYKTFSRILVVVQWLNT